MGDTGGSWVVGLDDGGGVWAALEGVWWMGVNRDGKGMLEETDAKGWSDGWV